MKWRRPGDPGVFNEGEKETVFKMLMGIFLFFTIITVLLGIHGYYQPYLSFQNYLKELPAGFTTKFTEATYEFYFQGSYLIQIFLGLALIPVQVWAMFKPKALWNLFDRLFKTLDD